MKKIITTLLLVIILNGSGALACTGFTYADNDLVLVGNNEDYTLDCEPKINVYPSENGEYARIVFCNKPYPHVNMPYVEFGGMNEEGLFFDSFSHPYLKITNPDSKPVYNGWYIPNCLKSCSTVDEALEEFSQWVHPLLEYNQILIVDRFGDSAIIEGNEIIRKTGIFQVCTNFLQSHPEIGGYPCWRYETAVNMLENMDELSIDYFRDICSATHSEGMYGYTIYSNVYDLKNGVVYLYYMHDYSNGIVFNLSEEIKQGFHSYYMSDLFDDENNSPDIPETPNGPSKGKIKVEHTFKTSTSDQDKDRVYYFFDWGDGIDSGWLGPYESGMEIESSHTWTEAGNFEIRVKAKDSYGAESEWSEPLPVSMPKYRINSNVLWLLQNFFDTFHFNIVTNLAPEGILAFSTERDGNYEIYTMRPDGTILDRLTNNPSKDWLPAWSPDGKKLAFVSDRNGNEDIFVMDIAEGDINCLTYDSEYLDLYPDWSPDGSKIVFVSNRDGTFQIYSMNSDGSNPKQLTDIPGNNLGPCWSPDGEKILFSSDYGQGFNNQDIYVMSNDGSNITCLLDDPGPDTLPRWSPDGSTICFASINKGEDIFLMNADGSERRLLVSRESNDFDPRWSPDGRYIAFGTAYENNDDEVAIVEISSGEITRLTYSPGWDSTVSWINIDNVPPLKPDKPSGASSGKINEEYIFSSKTTDHDNDSIYYLFYWGDGTDSGWLGPYDSGETFEASHIWNEEGNFEVKVKAKDSYGLESEWSDPLSINIPKNKLLNYQNNNFIQFMGYLNKFKILSKFQLGIIILLRFIQDFEICLGVI